MEGKKDDDEISIDLSKIKNLFRKKKEGKPEVNKTLEAEDKEKENHAIETQEKKEEDEIDIDFSKIKNIFKSKKTETHEEKEHRHVHHAAEAAQEKKDDDEISLDFSKLKNIRNIFKKEGREKSEDDISVDLSRIKGFFIKHRVLLLLIIPIFLSIFLRVQPAYITVTDQWAADSVINSLRSQISGQISQQYPNLPDQNRNALVENELQKVLQQQKAQIDQQIAATSNFFKSKLQDDSGLVYLSTIDPYFWMRHSQNVLDNGHPGDEIRNNVPWDNRMLAPVGRPVPVDMFHAYFVAYLYKFLSFFNRDLSLAAVSFFSPILISALSVIPAFFITRKIAGNFGGFIAAVIVAIHPSFLVRTMGGISDTDGYNILFPLLIVWIFIEALEANRLRSNIMLGITGGIVVGLFSFTWGGWWYIFDFVIASAFLYMIYYSYVHRKELMASFTGFLKQKAIKNSVIFFAVFFAVSALSVTLFVNYSHFQQFYENPAGFAKLKEVGITTIWPNVFTTVAEQNPASLNNVINQVGLGEEFFFLIALIGITLTITRRKHEKLWFLLGTLAWYVIIFLLKIENLNIFLALIIIPIAIRILIALWESDLEIDIKYAILLIFWFVATIFASTKGVRFTLLLVPAFAIGFGIALGEAYRLLSAWISRGLNVNKAVSKITVMVVLMLLLVPPYISAQNTARNSITDFNDAWKDSLEKIKSDSKPDAIVNSWWDFGHWFKFWTDRRVTFDGTSQNSPQAYWIGKVLLTDDEDAAVGILRMLDCSGGSAAFESVNTKLNDGAKTVSLLNGIIVENKEKAKNILKEKFSDEEAEKILSQTHCQPPEDYFITSEDMVGKSGVWAHFGSWDFERALIYNTLKKKEYEGNPEKSVKFLQERNYSGKDAENLYYEVQSITNSEQANSWIAPWPGFAGAAGCSGTGNETFGCSIGGIPLVVNPKAHEAYAETTSGRLHPHKISFPGEDGITVKQYDESTIPLGSGRQIGIALVKDGESYSAVAMDSDLTASMFTRLFYQDGIGLRYFKKFSDERSIFGNRIIVWKVDWEGKEKNVIESVQVPEAEKQAIQAEEAGDSVPDSAANDSGNTQ
ncbi:hypothetical protein HYU09_05015 [Candidatus Woesearchaeota archaeon]|nr:hypothetical protein [Candidatus Woesearchaeota archaeon]